MKGIAAETEWTADLRAALEKLTAEHRARVDTVLAPFTVASFTGETPTAEELAERDRHEAARAPREQTKGKPPRRPEPLDLLNTLPLDALDATEDERLPAAVADLAAMQSHLAAMQSRLAGRLAEAATRKPRWRTVAWAHAQSGLSAPYFYERADPDHTGHLPFLKKRGRSVRVDEAGFWRWFKRR